ncbi:MAG: AAA family ATPase, partial [candidate division KSB1 bacterium]|nr:AAA family ATPase [candidate division KSB1 bacterium]
MYQCYYELSPFKHPNINKTCNFSCLMRKFAVNFTTMSENLQKYRFLSRFLPGPDSKRLVLITGARQTGKTTLARSFYRDLAYINLDAPENRERVREISSSRWHRDIGNAIIDEAQKEPIVFD